MGKFTRFLLFLVVCSTKTFAQSAYSVLPSPSQAIVLPSGVDNVAHAKVKNLTNGNITVTWQREVISLHDSMYTQVCDPTTCWSPNVSTQTFTLIPQDSGAMDVHFINEYELITTGIVHIKLTNQANPADTVRVVYLFDSQTLRTKDPLPAAQVRAFPNPFTAQLALDKADDVAAIRVYDLAGRQVTRQVATLGQRYALDALPIGTYILAVEDERGRVFQALEITKQ